MIYGPTLSQSSNVNRNMGPFSGKQPLPSSIQSLSDKELNERLGYRRVNLGPSKAPIQQQQQQIPHSPYSPYSKRNNYHGSIYMPDQETMYDMNAQQYPHQENTWSRNNHHQNNLNQRHDLYDSYTAYMNRDNPSSWFPVPSFQNNIPLENKPTYSHQQQQQQHQKPSSMNSYSQFNIPNSNMDNSNNKRNQLPYFQDISDLQLSHLIHQYQMELLRRQSERLLDTDYQLGHNYYNQPAEPPLHYIPSYYPQDHGLHLYGSNNHDKIIQKFNNLANQRLVAGIDEFFDELDHNRDGVIMVDELRNYLLLHEIH
ncbi:hypothetical protein MN116_005408 [Schistosoma mekongi]|uniref:EF-hand domain-containing protein n=1 Tax=Schistosoma mekongi TaxID=38744 RepID=A0AAE1ZE46_SCHME|nr:hypothetical protein MN116_005408 [Schistosoma mekongi]